MFLLRLLVFIILTTAVVLGGLKAFIYTLVFLFLILWLFGGFDD